MVRRRWKRRGAGRTRVHALDVDGGQRSLEPAGDLDSDRDTAASDTDDHRLVELERGDGLGQRSPGVGAIAEERRDPGDEAHALPAACQEPTARELVAAPRRS